MHLSFLQRGLRVKSTCSQRLTIQSTVEPQRDAQAQSSAIRRMVFVIPGTAEITLALIAPAISAPVAAAADSEEFSDRYA